MEATKTATSYEFYEVYRRNDFYPHLDSRHLPCERRESLEEAKHLANASAISTPPMKRGGLEPLPATFCVDRVTMRKLTTGWVGSVTHVFQTTI